MNSRHFCHTQTCTNARSLKSKRAETHTRSHVLNTNTLWKNQQTQKRWLETKNSAEKQQWSDEEKWENEEKKNMFGQRRLERAAVESLISSRSFYSTAKRRGRENNTNMKRLCFIPTLNRRSISLKKKKVYKINFITALQRCCKINTRFMQLWKTSSTHDQYENKGIVHSIKSSVIFYYRSKPAWVSFFLKKHSGCSFEYNESIQRLQ